VLEKREGQIDLVLDHLQPRGFERETFAGQTAHPLDRGADRRAWGGFIEAAQQRLGVPGVALGLVQDGKVVFAAGSACASSAASSR